MKAAVAFAVATAAVARAMPNHIEARASSSSSGSDSLPTVTVQGNAFFAGGERFYIKGLDYQPGGSSGSAGSSGAQDPIADVDGCKRDMVEFKKLRINTVRVYTVDNTADHDECMGLLAEAGIYLALDVNTPKYSLNRGDPAASYNPTYLQSVFATIDAFAKYSNTLLFFSGNEVINADNNTNCAPYVKYIGDRGYRNIPVGYSAADVESNRIEMAHYMNCGSDDQRSDFFAFNDYSWCDPSSYTVSGWDQKVKKFSDYSIPLFLSEYGCITNTRTFEEVDALYGPQMTPVYSGGLVYEYSSEGNGYGLVTISGNSVTESADFTDLMAQFANNTPTGDGGYNKDGAPSTCPSQSSTWQVTEFTGDELPAMPSGAVQYLSKGAGKGPGLSGSGSQEAPGGSSATATPGSGAVTDTASGSSSTSTKSGAANALITGELGWAPLVCTAVVMANVLLGTALW